MRVLVAVDSFKGCASSYELAKAVENGIKKVYPKSKVDLVLISDGGEGMVEAFEENGTLEFVTCKDPLNRDIKAKYVLIDNNKAVIEVASSSGLPLLNEDERNPLIASSFGVGQVIKDALKKGVKEFIVGLGGSATNDAGLGMLRALGYRFLDNYGNEVLYAKDLSKIVKIDSSDVLQELDEAKFLIASDVLNPLCGENGASFVYAKQKGANEEMIKRLDFELECFADLVKKELHVDFRDTKGAGAAGGLGFSFLSFFNSEIKSGIKIVLEALKVEKKIQKADIVITGEGRVDIQSTMGKVIDGISSFCKKYNKPCIVLGGDTKEFSSKIYDKGVSAVFSIQDSPRSLFEAMKKEVALRLVEKQSVQIFRVIKSAKNLL